MPLPCHLTVSGRNAPHIRGSEAHVDRHPLADTNLIEELRRLEGTPEEILSNQELMTALLPVIRSDFKLVETHQYVDEPPLPIPGLALGATEDTHVR